jgi:RimJ/RimL family protein N-acetyltransferase
MPALRFPEPPLSDGVVALRPWRDEDVAVKATWGRDPELVRWTGVPAGQNEATSRAHARHAEEARQAGRMIALAIVDARSGAVIGSCDIRRPDVSDPALGELGYLLVADARGRGLATRAVWLLVGWSLRELGMGRVQALVHPENPPSARVLERLGFTREGLLGGYRPGASGREDRVMYALRPGELRDFSGPSRPSH